MDRRVMLTAARKRLKKFQLSKDIQSQENATAVKNNPQPSTRSQVNDESSVPNENVPEATALISSNNNGSAKVEPSAQVVPELDIPPSTNEVLQNIEQNVVPNPEITVPDAKQFFDNAVDASRQSNLFINSNHESPTVRHLPSERYFPNDSASSINFISSESIAKTDYENYKSEPKAQEEIIPTDHESLNGSSSLQKEYLRQMTSAVTNLLTNDDDVTDTRFEAQSDLEQRNEFLASCLHDQKESTTELHVELSHHKSRIAELESILATRDADIESKAYQEINQLKEQLQAHVQTTGILVGEKAELTAALLQSQTSAKQKAAQVEDINARLKSLQIHCADLEKELNIVKNNSEDIEKMNQQLQISFNTLEMKFTELKQEKDDLELETSELKQKLTVKNTELINAQQELKEKNALLSLHELRIQQMTSSTQDTRNVDEPHHVVAALEQQLSQLMETLKSVSNERDEASSHYQNYVQQLNGQVTTLAQKLEDTMKENVEISNRERSLIQRLSEMERQLQIQKELPPPIEPDPVPDNREQVSELTKNVDELVIERDSLRAKLHEKDLDIEALKREVDELQEIRNRDAEAARLVSALEGERLAAARAVSQNHELKQQLSEMQDVYIQLSNTKLDLTEQLHAERTIGRKLNAKLNDTENDMEKLKDEIATKNKRIAEFEKEKLYVAQIADQMQHYQAQSQNVNTVLQELHRAKELIDILTKENQQLMSNLRAEIKHGNISIDDTVEPDNINPQADDIQANNVIQSDEDVQPTEQQMNESQSKSVELLTTTTQTDIEDDPISTSVCPNIVENPEAVRKLEERFKETMERLAEVSDEKQRLEHLVLQLQSETETIGEYVTLYQNQRGILQERAKAKEEAFRQLTEQRNQQQEQLHKLKKLVAELIKNKNVTTRHSTVIQGEDATTIATEQQLINKPEDAVVEDHTTSQILDLLTEIKECKENCASEPNFHPCPWCSGKLITV